MAQKKKVTAKIVSQKQIGEQIFDLWLETALAKNAHPGQFVAVYPRSESMLLPRPISICEADKVKNRLRLVYRVAGKGTAE
ncbi:MAG: dihydroorotate dehydrogenase electron transfer subunit, partial [Lachnospiraceae bacterium]|nr:dihydroorotate dehydrogenase electron transfer subunit [Lachnospiraceae bacterium]